MTRKETLAELIKAVEAGDRSQFRKLNGFVFSTPCQDMDLQLREENALHAFRGSLDAALALHNAALPYDWACVLEVNTHARAILSDTHDECIGVSDNPARAWLLAILRALYEMETGK